MQEQKLLKKKRKADCDGNKPALASACIDLAEMYISQERYEEAIQEYEVVADIYKGMGNILDFARANRGIGEAYIQLQEYDKALEYQQLYLDVAKQQKDKLEEQRALATIGHIHLTRFLNQGDNLDFTFLNLAYRAFKQSLVLCESLTDIKKYEHKDMIARLLSNLGVVEECKGNYDKGIVLLQKSIDICKSYDLFEQLYRGYTALGVLYTHKKMYEEAIQQYNLAYEVAGRLTHKVSLQCESLISKGDVLIKLADFHSAKNVLLKAYKLKDPNSSNHQTVEQNLKIVAAMCKAEDTLLTTGNSNFKVKKCLYEKLGDGACRLKNFSSAIEYYHKMLEAAIHNNESGLDLSPCYISLAETYRDNKQFEKAIEYFKEDYNILKNNPRDGVISLLSIADCMESTTWDRDNIENTYNEALTICKAIADKQMEFKVLTKYIPVLKKHKKFEKVLMFEKRLQEIDHVAGESESESVDDQNTPNIGDDISINDITDISDESDSENRTVRKRAKRFVVKKNNKGETQLHTACIKGNFELVKRLLDQGHPVNVRDNCGWLPIHEACICGHLDIVKILIENGALINDRGGTLCQGITPLHDAALNGHLEVMQLLLDKGASTIVKNDNGEIPLHLLKVWKASENLSNDELILYDILVKRLAQDAEKLGVALDSHSSVSSNAIVKETCQPIYTSTRAKSQNKTQVGALRRAVSFDKDLNQNPRSVRMKAETPAQSEYKKVMENLRHHARDETEKKRKSNDKVGAHVENDLDDWLEDDIGLLSKKRKTGAADGFVNSTTTRHARAFDRHSSSSSLKSSFSNVDFDIPSDFFDADTDHLNDVLSDDDNMPSSSSNVEKCVLKKSSKKRQTSLIDNGFTRHRSFSPTTSTASRSSFSPSKMSSSSKRNSSSINLDMNNIFNTEPMLSVDVRISGRLYKVPVPASEIHTRTIKWLADEAAKRYSRKECMKPDLELETKNGAVLADEDLISVLFSAGITHAEEVEARIVKCNILPLSERYSEACTLENITPPKELLRVLEETSTILNLTDLNLRDSNVAPLFKVINRQVNLNSLNICGNFIHDGCVQILCASLPLLENLTELNLSLNRLTCLSLQHFSDMFVQASKPVLPNLVKLDLSHNPLGNKSINYLAIVTRYIRLRTLILVDVDFTIGLDNNVDLVLDSVVNFDVSYNQMSNNEILTLLSWIKPNFVETLNISSNTEVSEGLLKEVVQVLQQSDNTKLPLKCLNMSRTHATDAEIFQLLRVLNGTYQFQSLDLSYNANITSLSLRRLIQSYPSFDRLNLVGCENIFKYFQDCTDDTWSCVQLKELKFSCEFSKYFMEKNYIVDMWRKRHKSVIVELPNFVHLSITE